MHQIIRHNCQRTPINAKGQRCLPFTPAPVKTKYQNFLNGAAVHVQGQHLSKEHKAQIGNSMSGRMRPVVPAASFFAGSMSEQEKVGAECENEIRVTRREKTKRTKQRLRCDFV